MPLVRALGWLALIGFVGLTLIVGSATAAEQAGSWQTITVKDEWGNPTGTAAVSDWTASSQEMSPPYHDVLVRMMVKGCRDVSIEFTKSPNLLDGIHRVGVFNRALYSMTHRLRAKWNDGREFRVRARQDVGGKDLHFFDRLKLPQIRGNETFSVLLKWYGSGRVAWRFDLDGVSEALAAAGCR